MKLFQAGILRKHRKKKTKKKTNKKTGNSRLGSTEWQKKADLVWLKSRTARWVGWGGAGGVGAGGGREYQTEILKKTCRRLHDGQTDNRTEAVFRSSTLSLPQAIIIGFCKQHRSRWDGSGSTLFDVQSYPTLHINVFLNDSLFK